MQKMMENLKSFFNDFLGWFRHIHDFIQRTQQKKTKKQIDSYLLNKKQHYSGQKSEKYVQFFGKVGDFPTFISRRNGENYKEFPAGNG